MVSSNSIIVTREKAPAKKQAIVREVLADLPEWFGLPASTQEYIDAAATLPLWVAKQ
ncbi:GNAT family acetyltransferase, partial [Lacticaseibacillus rhamnosus]